MARRIPPRSPLALGLGFFRRRAQKRLRGEQRLLLIERVIGQMLCAQSELGMNVKEPLAALEAAIEQAVQLIERMAEGDPAPGLEVAKANSDLHTALRLVKKFGATVTAMTQHPGAVEARGN